MPLPRRLFLASTMAAIALPAAAQTASEIALFKIVSAKDEIVIGLSRADLGATGAQAVDQIAARIAQAGRLAVWQYAPRRDAQGNSRMTPTQRVVIFASGIVRIEPVTVDGPIQPPPG
ncbi:MAG: hypothetical protein FJX57_24995 [Alphaproteobacteria bacterium]|nr:hypothetical protein [Alphaproteobacteria bacterium]